MNRKQKTVPGRPAKMSKLGSGGSNDIGRLFSILHNRDLTLTISRTSIELFLHEKTKIN